MMIARRDQHNLRYFFVLFSNTNTFELFFLLRMCRWHDVLIVYPRSMIKPKQRRFTVPSYSFLNKENIQVFVMNFFPWFNILKAIRNATRGIG